MSTLSEDTPHPGQDYELDLDAYVLVIGGGPAGAWAALSASACGAGRVVLVDKGYCGTSGATAPASTCAWYVAPGSERERAVDARFERAGASRGATGCIGPASCVSCPTNALFVNPLADAHERVDEAALEAQGQLGSYSQKLGWRSAKPGGTAADPTFRFRVLMSGAD